jgi:hypothetical protein
MLCDAMRGLTVHWSTRCLALRNQIDPPTILFFCNLPVVCQDYASGMSVQELPRKGRACSIKTPVLCTIPFLPHSTLRDSPPSKNTALGPLQSI